MLGVRGGGRARERVTGEGSRSINFREEEGQNMESNQKFLGANNSEKDFYEECSGEQIQAEG